MRPKHLQALMVLLIVFVMPITVTAAQDPGVGSPQPPSSAGPKEAATGAPVFQDQEVVADTQPLAGAQILSLGIPASGHSFLLPSFGVVTTVAINPYSSSVANSPTDIESTFLTGRLAWNRSSGHSILGLDYLAGGTFSNDSSRGSSGIQDFHFSDLIGWGRWTVMFGDQLTYTALSPFGFGGLGGLNNLGVGLGASQFNPGFLPNQSVQINGSAQLNNAAIGELDYALTHRSSLTFSGSYGMLKFFDNALQDNTNTTFQGGYNYLLDRLNSVALIYRFNDLQYSSTLQPFPGIQDHSAQFSFARRVTGRLSFQAGAGPDVRLFQSPIAGSSTIVTWNASAFLSYQRRTVTAKLNYFHSLTGGSGVFLGASTDMFTGSLDKSFNRDWSGGISTGYSRNHALQQTTINASAIAPQSWFVTARLSRQFVRYGSLYFSYGASGQTNLASVCALPVCQVNSLTQTISIGYNWGLRPIVLE